MLQKVLQMGLSSVYCTLQYIIFDNGIDLCVYGHHTDYDHLVEIHK